MGANSRIEWTHHTFNPWQGCVKISPACTNCYAAATAHRFGVEWGPKARRRFASERYWAKPRAWNNAARRAGERHRVFCASMADVFEALPEGHPDADAMDLARGRLWALIEETPHLDWLLLTKRPENITVPVPDSWLDGFPVNVWIGATVESQAEADRRIPELLRVPAAVRFLSCEPLLGPVEFSNVTGRSDAVSQLGKRALDGIHWVIVGTESGPGRRPLQLDWAESIVAQCRAAEVPVFVKQLPIAGRVSHDLDDFPAGLRVREFPG